MPVFVCNGKAKVKGKKLVSSDWALKLAESDKGSYFDQEQLLNELNEQPSAECDPSISSSTCSASRSKITVEEPLADLESTETWQKIHGHAIVAGERLQEKINESVTCRFCQGSVQLVENLGSKSGLGSVWMFQCQNESCPSQECYLPFSTTEKSRASAINRASVLGFRAIGGGHAAASKVFSFLSPINKNYWADHTKKIEQETKLLLEDNLNRAAHDVKEFKFSNGDIGVDCSFEELEDTIIDIGVTIERLSNAYCYCKMIPLW